jgi:hypothetical protein
VGSASATPSIPLRQHAEAAPLAATPVIDWSNEARRAIVPAGPGGSFGTENFGNKFPGEAAVYMGIVHAGIYDAAEAIEGGYQPFKTTTLTAPANTSPEAAIAPAQTVWVSTFRLRSSAASVRAHKQMQEAVT